MTIKYYSVDTSNNPSLVDDASTHALKDEFYDKSTPINYALPITEREASSMSFEVRTFFGASFKRMRATSNTSFAFSRQILQAYNKEVLNEEGGKEELVYGYGLRLHGYANIYQSSSTTIVKESIFDFLDLAYHINNTETRVKSSFMLEQIGIKIAPDAITDVRAHTLIDNKFLFQFLPLLIKEAHISIRKAKKNEAPPSLLSSRIIPSNADLKETIHYATCYALRAIYAGRSLNRALEIIENNSTYRKYLGGEEEKEQIKRTYQNHYQKGENFSEKETPSSSVKSKILNQFYPLLYY